MSQMTEHALTQDIQFLLKSIQCHCVVIITLKTEDGDVVHSVAAGQ